MILIYIAKKKKNVHVLINFCTQIFYKLTKTLRIWKPGNKFDLAIKNV